MRFDAGPSVFDWRARTNATTIKARPFGAPNKRKFRVEAGLN